MNARTMSKKKRLKNVNSNVIDAFQDINIIRKQNLRLPTITPLTQTQEELFDKFDEGQNLILHGLAGTGKTFCAMYLALDELFNGTDNFQNITIIRSVVPTRDMGYLPGKATEKTAIYEQPYQAISTELFERGDAYQLLKQKEIITFISTSFIRGITLNNSIVIVDEFQNMNFHELDSVVTRLGRNCKILFCGDFRQSDLSEKEESGLSKFMKIASHMNKMSMIEFNEQDIVRSGFVKDYILARDKLKIA